MLHFDWNDKTKKTKNNNQTKVQHYINDGKNFKAHILCKIHFYMVFGHTCVLEVCEHIHSTMIKIHQL